MDKPEIEKEKELLPPADWAVEIMKLQEDLINERERNLRTLADFKNYRRRVERDSSKLSDEGKRAILISLLDIVDDMEKALAWADPTDLPLLEGLRMIHQKFLGLLAKNGVTPFDSAGTPFDHNLHEAVAVLKRNGYEPGSNVDQLRRGYLWNGELLRPAQVRVAG
jgi:molecular chaperone GrpE